MQSPPVTCHEKYQLDSAIQQFKAFIDQNKDTDTFKKLLNEYPLTKFIVKEHNLLSENTDVDQPQQLTGPLGHLTID